MKNRFFLLAVTASFILLITGAGCNSDKDNPKALLDKYFSSAIKQDYASVYDCYYRAYKEKISRDEYIKHRKQASELEGYKILALNEHGSTADAEAQLTFSSSNKSNRKGPLSTKVKEELVKEGGEWKIKVW